MCYVGKATKIFIFIVIALVITGLVLGFGLINRVKHKSVITNSPTPSNPSTNDPYLVPERSIPIVSPPPPPPEVEQTPPVTPETGSSFSPPSPLNLVPPPPPQDLVSPPPPQVFVSPPAPVVVGAPPPVFSPPSPVGSTPGPVQAVQV